ncbi:HAD family hydrolase [Methanococcoides burtonii]|uniref:Haloacid dehalogenase-like hydrolase n=1 Tax=Methanococcoides burtonii (strain DSM 6242 / NBRC 107633 / OCM 468 / ACE-M) TaxID=259564 RepID=Q12VM3_METBU|nr:HAD hydrolase-like protein [Methanococcoides burtonii]ABE52503.1 Haloacid dehalogenase-like hydrolase [Methanococcoides burtonii DSM 6242]
MKIKNIIFDFDGVILNSMAIKTKAFRDLFSSYPKNVVDDFIEYHLKNGGVSRYRKIDYFHKQLLGIDISEKEILEYAQKYSSLTRNELTDPNYLIQDTFNFIKCNHSRYNMHIASGADEKDLIYICNGLEISKYFMTINGSPIIKSEIIDTILTTYKYKKEETCLIGDSINDHEAAKKNSILFFGYNCKELAHMNEYISTFNEFDMGANDE